MKTSQEIMEIGIEESREEEETMQYSQFFKMKWYSEEEFKSLFRENQIFIDYINDKNLVNGFLIYIKEKKVDENE